MNELQNETTKVDRISWWKYIAAILAFWLLSIFGGSVPMLINALSPAYLKYYPGDLGYSILYICSTAIGCGLAVAAFNGITDHKAPVCGLVNCLIAAILMIALCINTFIVEGFSIGVTIIFALVLIVYGYAIAKYIVKIKEMAELRPKTSFRRRPYIVCISILTIAVMALGTCSLLLWSDVQKKDDKIISLESDNKLLDSSLTKEKVALANLENKTRDFETYKSLYEFVDSNVVFVTQAGGKYHRYSCYYFQNSDSGYYVFNVEYAKWLGYQPCLECNPPQ
ncbi:MAG: hypothetical protein ACOX7G_09935 [Candidatus Scatomorpha sp.]|jgi:hypothetical protein